MTACRPADSGEALLDLFERRGCERVDTPVLQPAELFLDLSGEDIRRRLFLTQDSSGRELCLRPEHTIPVCRQHVASGRATAEYCYLGPVFRQRREGFGEFLQVGTESIGRTDPCPADADALGLAIDAFSLVSGGQSRVRIGDMGLFGAVMDALEVAPVARRRITRRLAAGGDLATVLGPDPRPAGGDYAGLLAAIAGRDAGAARAFVEDLISISGVAKVGGRSAGEIAERFLSKAENRSGDLSARARSVLTRYLAIRGDLDEAADRLRQLAREEKLDLGPVLDQFEERTGFIAALDIDLSRLAFAADFARVLDYYTGFIFEVREEGRPDGWYAAAGGRYDRLFEHLGAGRAVPAVGCSFWLDRFPDAS